VAGLDTEITRNTLRGARVRLEEALGRSPDGSPNELVDVGYLTKAACVSLVEMIDIETQRCGL
jgi:hypothetical protein